MEDQKEFEIRFKSKDTNKIVRFEILDETLHKMVKEKNKDFWFQYLEKAVEEIDKL